MPTSRLGWFNGRYPQRLYLDTRGSNGRTPTDYEMNLSLGYNLNVGPVTITPMFYVFNLLNRQTPTRYDQGFNPGGSFVTNPESPYYGQPGVEPGTGSCPASASCALLGQPGLPQGHPVHQPEARPRCPQDHLLRGGKHRNGPETG